MYICLQIHIELIYVYRCISIHISISVYKYTWAHIYIWVYIYTHTHIWLQVYMSSYIYIWVCIYTYMIFTNTNEFITLDCPNHRQHYGVARISRLLKSLGLFCRISLFNRALLQKRPIILRSLLIVATPYAYICVYKHVHI